MRIFLSFDSCFISCAAESVFHAEGDTPYDHISVIATNLTMMGISKDKWGLVGRTANAPTFEKMFEGNQVRTDDSGIEVNSKGKTSSLVASESATNEIHMRMTQSLLNRTIKQQGLSSDTVKGLSLSSLQYAKTPSELSRRLKSSLKKLQKLSL